MCHCTWPGSGVKVEDEVVLSVPPGGQLVQAGRHVPHEVLAQRVPVGKRGMRQVDMGHVQVWDVQVWDVQVWDVQVWDVQVQDVKV